MTDKALQDWITLQMVGIELVERQWPVIAAHVRLGVEIGKEIHAGRADNQDYTNFEYWHYQGKAWRTVPCWQR